MRTVDPYDDVDVIDARAPRFNQAVVGLVSVGALVTGWWWLYGVLALQLALGLAFGRRFCLPCVFYFEVVQPRFGEGTIEDARPPRFANILGAVVLSAATLTHATGLDTAGSLLGGVVGGLALLSAVTGLCAGCEIYKLVARLRGIRPGAARRIDLDDIGRPVPHGTVVQFTHPLCGGCDAFARRLVAQGRQVVEIDVSRRVDLARKYGISVVPTAVAVGDDGHVLERLA